MGVPDEDDLEALLGQGQGGREADQARPYDGDPRDGGDGRGGGGHA